MDENKKLFFRRWGIILLCCLLSALSFWAAILLTIKLLYHGRAEYNFFTSIAAFIGVFRYHSILMKPWSIGKKIGLIIVTFVCLYIILPELFMRVLLGLLGFGFY